MTFVCLPRADAWAYWTNHLRRKRDFSYGEEQAAHASSLEYLLLLGLLWQHMLIWQLHNREGVYALHLIIHLFISASKVRLTCWKWIMACIVCIRTLQCGKVCRTGERPCVLPVPTVISSSLLEVAQWCVCGMFPSIRTSSSTWNSNRSGTPLRIKTCWFQEMMKKSIMGYIYFPFYQNSIRKKKSWLDLKW